MRSSLALATILLATSPAPGQDPAEDPARLSALGRERLRSAAPTEDRTGLAEAEALLARAIEGGAADVETFAALGETRRLLGRGAPDERIAGVYRVGAGELRDRALAAGPDHPAALLLDARLREERGEDDAAAASYRKAAARGSAEAWEALGLLEYRHGNYAAARDAAREALRLEPGRFAARKLHADATFRMDDPAGAAPLYARLLAELPAGAPEELARDLLLTWKNSFEVRLQPGVSPESAEALGAEIEGSALGILAARPDLADVRAGAPEVLRRVAYHLGAKGAHDKAALAHVRAVRVSGGAGESDPSFRSAFLAAVEFVKRGDREKGGEILRTLRSALGPGRARAWVEVSLATEARDEAKADEATALYRTAVDDAFAAPVPPGDTTDLRGRSLNDLGLVRFGEGDLSGARAAFERAIAENPRSLFAIENLARLAARQGRPDEARALLRQALDAAAAWPDEAERLHHSWRIRLFVRWLG